MVEFIVLIILTILSCNFANNIEEIKNSNVQDKYVTIYGKFNLQGAVPSVLYSTSTSRSAVPSIPNGITYFIIAEKSDGTTESPIFIDNDTGSFEIKLTKGEWTINGEILKDSKKILNGNTNVEITDDFPIKKDIEIIVKPFFFIFFTGTVNLAVTIENTCGIKRAQIRWTD